MSSSVNDEYVKIPKKRINDLLTDHSFSKDQKTVYTLPLTVNDIKVLTTPGTIILKIDITDEFEKVTPVVLPMSTFTESDLDYMQEMSQIEKKLKDGQFHDVAKIFLTRKAEQGASIVKSIQDLKDARNVCLRALKGQSALITTVSVEKK